MIKLPGFRLRIKATNEIIKQAQITLIDNINDCISYRADNNKEIILSAFEFDIENESIFCDKNGKTLFDKDLVSKTRESNINIKFIMPKEKEELNFYKIGDGDTSHEEINKKGD